MVVLVLTACPAGLRGYLTRWLLEISPGVFTGVVSTRVRDLMWSHVVELAKDGRVIMVHSAANEQRQRFKVLRHDWIPVDIDGVQLMMRPGPDAPVPKSDLRPGWSSASRYRTARRKRGQTT